MPDNIWKFQDVIAEALESRGLKMLKYSRVIWRYRQSREDLDSKQEYRLSLRDESGQEKRVTLLIDDDTSQESVRSQLAQGLEE